MRLSLIAIAALLLAACGETTTAELAQANAAKGAAFLAENGKRSGIHVLASGLQYEELRPGSGRQPELRDRVTVHYRGSFIDSREFDSSYARGKPAEFAVDSVITGWSAALRLMREGAKWRLYIPPELAYGRRGAGDAIGPNETLIFEVELLRVN